MGSSVNCGFAKQLGPSAVTAMASVLHPSAVRSESALGHAAALQGVGKESWYVTYRLDPRKDVIAPANAAQAVPQCSNGAGYSQKEVPDVENGANATTIGATDRKL
jgi:hypothetical protein